MNINLDDLRSKIGRNIITNKHSIAALCSGLILF